MSSTSLKQNKLKNTGVLFDLLVRQVTSDTMNKQSSPAVNILNKYFNTGTELGRELQLYRAFFDTRSLTETKAIHFIDLIVEQRKKINDDKLSKEKYQLIKEIKNSYNLKDFLSAKIPNYTVHASIYKTFLSETVGTIPTEAFTEVASAKFLLIEQLSKSPVKYKKPDVDPLIQEFCSQPEEVRLITFKNVIDNFNKKYSTLSESQKSLLSEYINNASDTTSLLEYVKKEVSNIRTQLLKKAKATSEPVIRIKLNEVATQLATINKAKSIKDSHITSMLISYEILKEIG